MVLVSFITALVAELSGAALGFGPAILYASWVEIRHLRWTLKSCSLKTVGNSRIYGWKYGFFRWCIGDELVDSRHEQLDTRVDILSPSSRKNGFFGKFLVMDKVTVSISGQHFSKYIKPVFSLRLSTLWCFHAFFLGFSFLPLVLPTKLDHVPQLKGLFHCGRQIEEISWQLCCIFGLTTGTLELAVPWWQARFGCRIEGWCKLIDILGGGGIPEVNSGWMS